MFRLLIVDDEKIITDGIFEILSRVEDLELEIYKTYSSLEAKELIDKTRFDIVLTDIQMPGINGLQLAAELRVKWPKCRIVFLTGHYDFEYVYEAIKHERVNYILKTEGYDKMIEAVRFAVSDTASYIKAEEMQQYVKEQQSKLLHASRQQFFLDVIKGHISSEEVNPALFTELQIALNAHSKVILLLGKFKRSANLSYTDQAKLYYEMEWLAANYFKDLDVHVVAVTNNPYMIWVIQPKLEPKEHLEQEQLWISINNSIMGHLDQLQELFCSECKVDISFILDDQPISWAFLSKRYEQLELLFQYRIGTKQSQVILRADMVNDEQTRLMQKSKITPQKYERLQAYLSNGQAVEFMKCLEEVKHIFFTVDIDSYAEEIYLSVALIYLTYINRWNLHERVSQAVRLQSLLHFNEHGTRTAAMEYLFVLGEQLLAMQNQEEEERATIIIDKLKAYIYDNLQDPNKCTLIHLSELVFFNASYLSRLFKQVTNVNLSDFITHARIEKAKQLLRLPELKIQDIAEQVGYSNGTNFTRVFRKLTGVTPQDYRTSIIYSN